MLESFKRQWTAANGGGQMQTAVATFGEQDKTIQSGKRVDPALYQLEIKQREIYF